MSTTDFREVEDENDVDVVIVGAGLTGLTTAYNILIRKPMLDVLIIEKADEAGGRVLSRGYSEYYYASYVQNHVTRLLQRLNIETCSGQNANIRRKMFFTKNGPVDQLPNCVAAEVRYFLQTLQENRTSSLAGSYANDEIRPDLAWSSIDQLLKELVFLSYARSICRTLVYSICGMRDLCKVSALWTLVMLDGAGGIMRRLKVTMGDESRYFVRGGMTRLTEKLLDSIRSEDGNIIYGESVTKVEYNEDRAYCYTTRNCFKCEIVVLAVSPPEISSIPIEPALPENVSRSQTLYHQSDNIFFNVFYKEPFWENEYSGDVLTTPNSNSILNVAYGVTCDDTEQGIMAGFLNETNLLRTTSKLLLFETLSRCFRNDEAKRWIDYKEYGRVPEGDVTVKLASGWPMSVMQPCHISNHIDHIQASTDRTLFAASEYATEWPGMIDGAIETGEITARLVLLKIRPQALSFYDMVTIISMYTTFRYRSNKAIARNSFPLAIIQFFCIVMNVAIFFSFVRTARNK